MSARFPNHLFVGVTTRQNTANLAPLVQFGATRYCPIQTPGATRFGWGEGLKAVTAARSIQHLHAIMLPANTLTITGTVEVLRASLPGTVPIAWILGGGRKSEQLALWTVFQERCRSGLDDVGLYADPGSGETILIREMTEQRIQTGADLSVDEVLACFGRLQQNGIPLTQNANWDAKVQRFRHDQVYRREWLHRTTGLPPKDLRAVLETMSDDQQLRQKTSDVLFQTLHQRLEAAPGLRIDNLNKQRELANSMVKALRNPRSWVPRPPPLPPLHGHQRFSTYFERLLQALVARHTLAGLVNPKIVHRDHPEKIKAEHDVLLVTREATLVSLDAKTYSVAGKELDARLLQLSRASGQLSRFIVVFPYFLDDLEFFPPALRRLPFRLHALQQPFAIFGPDEQDLILDERSEVEPSRSGNHNGIRCQSVESCLASLRL